ncbi:hypothetical protein GCM10010199_47470 [Dactylosporangium roseum]
MSTADGWRKPIDADRMTDAGRLTAFFIAHFKAAQHVIGGDPVTDTARSMLALARSVRGVGRGGRVRRVHRRPDRRGVRRPGRGRRPRHVDMDRAPADHPRAGSPDRQGDKGQAVAAA